VLVIGFGMGVAAGVPFIGLALGLWAAWLAWRGAERREQVFRLSLWSGFVSAGSQARTQQNSPSEGWTCGDLDDKRQTFLLY
jgi:hypothetical protein